MTRKKICIPKNLDLQSGVQIGAMRPQGQFEYLSQLRVNKHEFRRYQVKSCHANTPSSVLSATLARLDDHVGELLHFGGSSRVVEYGEGFQVLRDTAGRGRRLWIQSVVQAQQLLESTQETSQLTFKRCLQVCWIKFSNCWWNLDNLQESLNQCLYWTLWLISLYRNINGDLFMIKWSSNMFFTFSLPKSCLLFLNCSWTQGSVI